jgi:hypothetical protein
MIAVDFERETYVLGVAWDISQSALSGDSNEVGLQLLWSDFGNSVGRVLSWLEGEQVGQETSNVRRGHGSTRDGVDGVLAANPGGLNVQAWGEDVIALSEVGEVGTLISESRGTNGDRVLSSSWGIVARIGVIVTGGNSEVDTSINGSVNSHVESWRLATTKRHVGSGTLESLMLAILSLGGLGAVRFCGILDTLYDIGHGSRAVGAEDLDGNNVGLLGDTVFLASNGTRAVSAVAVSILISIVDWDGLAPSGTALEVNVLNVGTGVDDIDIDTLTTVSGV